jgi:2-keto-4-pentenoate hydratase
MRIPTQTFLGLALVASLLVPTNAIGQNTEEWADAILKAKDRRQPFPALAGQAFGATERQAYAVQRAVIDRMVSAGDSIVGHKAGLTTEAAQAKFDVFEPVAGSLLKSQVKNTATFVSLRQMKGAVVEMEIGFELKLSIRSAPRDVEELKGYVRQIVPVVEIPNLDFDPPERVMGADIIASNVAAAVVVKGRPKPMDLVDLTALQVSLSRNNEEISIGDGADAMGDPWEALLWLVQQRLREGYEVKRNDLLITGALGEVVPAEAGRYVANFGRLGRVTFSMR